MGASQEHPLYFYCKRLCNASSCLCSLRLVYGQWRWARCHGSCFERRSILGISHSSRLEYHGRHQHHLRFTLTNASESARSFPLLQETSRRWSYPGCQRIRRLYHCLLPWYGFDYIDSSSLGCRLLECLGSLRSYTGPSLQCRCPRGHIFCCSRILPRGVCNQLRRQLHSFRLRYDRIVSEMAHYSQRPSPLRYARSDRSTLAAYG